MFLDGLWGQWRPELSLGFSAWPQSPFKFVLMFALLQHWWRELLLSVCISVTTREAMEMFMFLNKSVMTMFVCLSEIIIIIQHP